MTPDLALAYLTALSADIEVAAVLDSEGNHLAGDPRLSDAARELPPNATHPHVHAASSATHTIVLVTGPFALPRLTRHDLTTALTALSGAETTTNTAPTPLDDATGNAFRQRFSAP